MSDLLRAVRINEEIKRIVLASRQINLVALNALLTARQAGARSRGFAVVARELRTLSGSLEGTMNDLDATISTLTNDLAEGLKGRRVLAYVEAAVAADTSARTVMALTSAAARTRYGRIQETIADGWLRLGREVRRAIKLAEFGGAISRSAKVEAVSGGDMSRVLTQVADQVESAIAHISTRLRGIRTLAER